MGIEDPWVKFPALSALTAGLQKQIAVPPLPKIGLIIVMLKDMLRYIDTEEAALRRAGQVGVADVLLRNAVALILAFFGMHCSDEISLTSVTITESCSPTLFWKRTSRYCYSHQVRRRIRTAKAIL